jgi:kynurenine formamidase
MSSRADDLKAAGERARQVAAEPGPDTFPRNGEQLLNRSGRVIDLSRPIYEGMPEWYGHQRTFIFPNQDYEQFREKWKTHVGFYARNLIISEHAGTHTDAVVEYLEGGPALDESPLAYYWGSAVCLDMSDVRFADPDPEGNGFATADRIQAAEAKLEANGEEVREGDIVLLWYDWGDRIFPDPRFMEEWPGLSFDGGSYLAEKGVVNLGTDCAGIDNSTDENCSGHMACRHYGIVNTEALTNLGQLVNRRFWFFGLPLNIRGGTGSPIRAVAWFPPGD